MSGHPFAVTVKSVLVAVLLAAPSVAGAQTEPDRAGIERLVDDWYAQQCAGEEGRPYNLMAPGGVDASPAYAYRDTGSAALGPRYFIAMAATEPLFRYEVSQVRADALFARVRVRERAYRYAGAAKVTYERMGDTLLVLERQDDGRWLVLAHETHSIGFHPSEATVPLPDLGPGPNGQARPLPGPRCGRFRAGEFWPAG